MVAAQSSESSSVAASARRVAARVGQVQRATGGEGRNMHTSAKMPQRVIEKQIGLLFHSLHDLH